MLVPPVTVLLVPSDGNAALGGEKRKKKVLWNPVVFDVLEIFYLEVLKAKAMEKK